jgi:hypothetical protein
MEKIFGEAGDHTEREIEWKDRQTNRHRDRDK